MESIVQDRNGRGQGHKLLQNWWKEVTSILLPISKSSIDHGALSQVTFPQKLSV